MVGHALIANVIRAKTGKRRITVRRTVDHTLEETVKQQYTLPKDGVLRYEGEKASPEHAFKKGRHARAHGSRKQTILAITPGARLETVAERKEAYPIKDDNSQKNFIWANEGYYAGFYHDKVFYTGEPFRPQAEVDKGLINTCQPGPTGSEPKLDGTKYLINGHFIASRAAMRPGGRSLFLPDRIHSNKNASHVILHPTDNGSIEGQVKTVRNDTLVLEVTRTPTGLVEDTVQKTLTVELNDDAKYHLNSQPGASRTDEGRKYQGHYETTFGEDPLLTIMPNGGIKP